MGMYAHLVPVSSSASELRGMSDDDLKALLRGPGSADLNKSWEAAFPLIGSIAGTGFFMMVDDPEPVGGDIGFGPAMFIDPLTVAAIAERLIAADEATVESHWATLDSPFMESGLYDDAEGKAFAMYGFAKATGVFVEAAAVGQGVVFAIM